MCLLTSKDLRKKFLKDIFVLSNLSNFKCMAKAILEYYVTMDSWRLCSRRLTSEFEGFCAVMNALKIPISSRGHC